MLGLLEAHPEGMRTPNAESERRRLIDDPNEMEYSGAPHGLVSMGCRSLPSGCEALSLASIALAYPPGGAPIAPTNAGRPAESPLLTSNMSPACNSLFVSENRSHDACV
jgi:hypothetical protein